MESTGRPEIAYCNSWRPKSNQLRHEVWLTDFLLCYPDAEVVRGWKVDTHIRPDAELTLHGRKFYVELDTGEQSHRQVRDRQQAYTGVQDFLLYVTLSPRRMAGLIERSRAVQNIALFTTLGQVQSDPHGDVWVDAFGQRAAI